MHQATERFIVLVGGRRSGKSLSGGREAFAQCAIPESRVWVVGPTMDLAEKEFRVVWDVAVKQGALPVRRKSERELYIEFENDSFIECRTEENPDQLIGEGLDLVVLAEAARLRLSTWSELIRPTLSDRHGRAILSSTPRGFNWYWDLYNFGLDPAEPDWRTFRWPTRFNPLIDETDLESARRTHIDTPGVFKQEYEASFESHGGSVFPEFSEDVHVRAVPFERYLRTALWVDPGMTSPYAVLLVQITPDEYIHVLDEIYVRHKVTDQVIRMAQEKWPHAMLEGDFPSQELEIICDEAAAEAVATWRMKGYRAWGWKPSIGQGIQVMHRMLRDPYRLDPVTPENPEGIHPRIIFSPVCKETIREFKAYHYPDEARRRIEANPTENPAGVDDHTIDCIRYGLFNTFPDLFNTVQPNTELLYLTHEDLGIDTERTRIDSSYSPLEYPDHEFRVSLGEF